MTGPFFIIQTTREDSQAGAIRVVTSWRVVLEHIQGEIQRTGVWGERDDMLHVYEFDPEAPVSPNEATLIFSI